MRTFLPGKRTGGFVMSIGCSCVLSVLSGDCWSASVFQQPEPLACMAADMAAAGGSGSVSSDAP